MRKIVILLIFTLLLTSCWENNKGEKVEVRKNIKVSFENPQNDLEKQVNKDEKELSDDYYTKLKLVQSYLNYWNSYFTEDTFANKALDILNKMEEDSKVDFFKWYAYEIQTKYKKALEEYNNVLAYENLDEKEKINSINQIGHVFDLQWFLEKANEQYVKAEELDPKFIKTMLNRWRYEARVWNNTEAEQYFNKILEETNDSFLKSEMYYNLSVINQSKKDWLDKAIIYAKRWIQANKDYPNNYLSLWVSYISKGWDFLDKAPEQLNKAIKLYPNSSTAYKNLGIYYYIKDDFNKAIESFKKQVEVSEKDILLMANDKRENKVSWQYDLAKAYALNSDVENTIKYLKIVLDWKNKVTYSWFLMENTNPNWPFRKISNEKFYKDGVKEIILKYNQK